MNEKVTQFSNFLERDFKANADQEKIKKMIQRNEKRLIVDVDDLRSHDRELCTMLLKRPGEYFPAFDKALKSIVNSNFNPHRMHYLHENEYYVGLSGSFGEHNVTPRTIGALNLGQVISMEGIITKCSLVRPKMVKSVHFCDKTKLFHQREYRDATSLGEYIPTSSTYPTEDDQGNALTTEFGYCTFLDHQMITVQEIPEKAPPGLLPRSLDVILEDDLVDSCKPGDRVNICGVYRSIGSTSAASASGTFRTLIVCKNVKMIDEEESTPALDEAEMAEIKRIGARSDITKLLSKSLAPSIFGHEHIKKALLLLLLGGMEKNLENGTHIRGDINILLLGDPSTAKSQFLRFILKLALLAIGTTGRGSSGVGLTAAVTHDKETGDRRLEAGAMVLADRGVVCIDEFDKMNDSDRVSIHEVMEQQTITIAKAGIHTSLNARCSVLAAANPTYGQYDESLEPHRNIRLPDSLLSRFDLLFVCLDKTDEETDRLLSTHVLKMHRDQVSESKGLFSKKGRSRKDDVLSIEFMKKYIFYAKTRVRPSLTLEASHVIVEAYAGLRNEDTERGTRKTLPVTARTLETLIRLSTAHAKSRLSSKVEKVDADAAIELLRFALFKEIKRKPKKRKIQKEKEKEIDESKIQDFKQRLDLIFSEQSTVDSSQLTSLLNMVPGTQFTEQEANHFLQLVESQKAVFIDPDTGLVYRM